MAPLGALAARSSCFRPGGVAADAARLTSGPEVGDVAPADECRRRAAAITFYL